MSYELEAILGRHADLQRHATRYPHARVISLNLGWAIVPLTAELQADLRLPTSAPDAPNAHDLFRAGYVGGQPRLQGAADPRDAWADPANVHPSIRPALTDWLEAMSRGDVVAYVQSLCFGGQCIDDAIVWRDGAIVLGPLHVEAGSESAINAALRFLGVPRAPSGFGGFNDPFDTLGLGRHRKTAQWVEAGNLDPPEAMPGEALPPAMHTPAPAARPRHPAIRRLLRFLKPGE